MADNQLTLFDLGPDNKQAPIACQKPSRKNPGKIRTGTRSGYRAHMDAKEAPCDLCREGRRAEARSYREENLEHIREYTRRYREENPEYFRDYGRKQRKENPEYFREHYRKRRQTDKYREYKRNYDRKRRAENPEHYSEYDRQYGRKHYRENPEMYRRQNRTRRARERSLPSDGHTFEDIVREHGTVCYLCGTEVDTTISSREPDGPHVDHVHPLAREGCPGDVLGNTAIVHAKCNLSKGAKLVSELTLPFPAPQGIATELPGLPARDQ